MMNNQNQEVIKKFKFLSDKHHKLSLLFYELAQSLNQVSKNKSFKDFKLEVKKLNLDIEKIKKISVSITDLNLKDIQKD